MHKTWSRAAAALAAVILVLNAAAIRVTAQELVSVYVFTARPVGGFIDQPTKQRNEATSTIEADLKKRKKTLMVVDSMEAADVVVQIMSAGPVAGDHQLGPDLLSGRATITKTTEFLTLARLSLGDYKRVLNRQAVTETLSAKLIADDVEQWIKENRKRVLESRRARSGLRSPRQ